MDGSRTGQTKDTGELSSLGQSTVEELRRSGSRVSSRLYFVLELRTILSLGLLPIFRTSKNLNNKRSRGHGRMSNI